MLTTIRLDGVLGKKFGKEWELEVSSPSEALRLIEANKPGLRSWILNNREKYDAYQVTCVYSDGRTEDLEDATYAMTRENVSMIRFTPVVSGSSSTVKIVVGAILVVAGVYFEQPWMVKAGATLMLVGVIEALSPRPKINDPSSSDNINSYYFDGPSNTDAQGNPVPLIYGRVLAGSHSISASINVDEMAIP